MEKLEYCNQVYQEHDSDHVGQDNTMTIFADGGNVWQTDLSCCTPAEAVPIMFSTQQGPRPEVRARRANTQLTWRRSSSSSLLGYLLFFVASLWIIPASAVFIEFQNCLSDSYQNDSPKQLQFDPLFVDAVFNSTDSSHGLYVTVWGNVTGTDLTATLPPANDTDYWGSNQTSQGGKILPQVDDGANKLTTLFNKVNVLTYLPWNGTYNFCEELINGSCPLAPSFNANAYVSPLFRGDLY
jgi:hypothetical protein